MTQENHHQSCLNFIPCRLKGTVLMRIWPQIFFMTAYSALIVALNHHVEGFQLKFPVSLITVMGGVTGLLLVFRTNTAYDRYWEGRKLWSSMTNHCRGLTLGIWVGLDGRFKKESDDDPKKAEKEVTDIVERLSAINLLLAFVYSTKNYLRGEYSYEESDVRDLISHLAKFRAISYTIPFDQVKNNSVAKNRATHTDLADGTLKENTKIYVSPSVPENGGNNKNHNVDENWSGPTMAQLKRGVKAYDVVTPTNIPLEIVYHLYSYLQEAAARGPVEANVMRNLQGSVLSLLTCLTEFERILKTPMPLAYSIHLTNTVYIFLLALPFQFVAMLHWWTVPVCSLASFALLGILAIGGEIENPFGYDENDLPLDDYCRVIRREIEMITGHSMPPTSSWVMSPLNVPMAPTSWLSAQELARESGDDVKNLLSRRADFFGPKS